MKLTKINSTCYYFDAVVNIGYIHHGEQGLLIDAGIDDSIMRKVLRQLNEKDLPVTHLFITHAHADHYGGANFLQKKHNVYTVAPKLEAAILSNPIIEPIYLFGGNDPIKELNNKFLQGKPIRIDQMIWEGLYEIGSFTLKAYLLPGHSYGQIAIEVDDILYAGDSYFGVEQLNKHKIPYMTDVNKTIESLKKLRKIQCSGAVPGHGKFELSHIQTVRENMTFHENMLSWMYNYLNEHPEGISHEQLVATMCNTYDINSKNLSQWLLFRTAVTAYVIGLIERDKVTYQIIDNKWIFLVK